MNIKELIEIATYLKLNEVVIELEQLEQRLQNPRTPLVLPLVGEFSAGKTSLLNALTDSKQLEVATQPTTSTIYELHFGQEKQYATIIQKDGQEVVVESIASLDNSQLGDVPLIKIYDTSTRVPRDLILVDTPGLSSPDQKHKDALIRFLPQADALLITVDCNQQITNSLLRFIEECNLVGRKVYLIITKCDTKPVTDMVSIKAYISENCNLPMEYVVCVSAQKENLSEFYDLIEKLLESKQQILVSSIQARVETLKVLLQENIVQLLQLPNSVQGLEEELAEQKNQIGNLRREIDDMISSVKCSIEDVSDDMNRRYKSLLFQRLESLLAQKSNNMTAEANTIVNSTSALIMSEYRNKMTQELSKRVKDCSFFIRSAVTRLDLSNLEGPNSVVNIDLDGIGHEMDKNIAMGIQFAAVAAVAIAAFPVSPNAAVGGAGAAGLSRLVSVADTATDVGSMIYTRRLIKRCSIGAQNVIQTGTKFAEKYSDIQSQITPKAKGMLEGWVGKITELWAKPKRRRVINEFVEQQLLPEFVIQMQHNMNIILSGVRDSISQESEQMIAEQYRHISELKDAIEAQNGDYQKKILTLKEYQTALNS